MIVEFKMGYWGIGAFLFGMFYTTIAILDLFGVTRFHIKFNTVNAGSS